MFTRAHANSHSHLNNTNTKAHALYLPSAYMYPNIYYTHIANSYSLVHLNIKILLLSTSFLFPFRYKQEKKKNWNRNVVEASFGYAIIDYRANDHVSLSPLPSITILFYPPCMLNSHCVLFSEFYQHVRCAIILFPKIFRSLLSCSSTHTPYHSHENTSEMMKFKTNKF